MKKSKISTMTVAVAALALMANVASAELIWTGASQEAFNSTTFQTLSPGNTAIANFNITSTTQGNTVTWGETWTNVGVGPYTVGGIEFTATGLNTLTATNYYPADGTAVLRGGNNNSSSPPNAYVTLSGFDAAKEYIIQFLIVDTRTGSILNRQSRMRERGTTNVSDIVKIGTAATSSEPYNNLEFGLITGTFTGGTSIVVEPLLSGGGTFNGNMAQVNAIRVVEVIPEPATLSMIGVVGIAMLLRRRIVKA